MAVLGDRAAWNAYGWWLLAAVLGNIVGGVLLVAILEYGQTIFAEESKTEEE